MMRLEGKTAVVTGSGAGFGATIASRFAEEGARVVLVDICRDGCEEVAETIQAAGGEVAIVIGDVAVRDTHLKAFERANQDFGRLHIWVNNAGIAQRNKSFEEISEDEFDRLFAVNVRSILHSAQVIATSSVHPDVILNVSSTVAVRPRLGLAIYSATKAAVNSLTKSLALELAPSNVRVNAICPTLGETRLLEAFTGMSDTPQNRQQLAGCIPLGRLAKPTDVASAAVFLASDEAEFLTGVTLEVDGGRSV